MYTNNQEFESIRLGETLSFLEDGKVGIYDTEKEHVHHFIHILGNLYLYQKLD